MKAGYLYCLIATVKWLLLWDLKKKVKKKMFGPGPTGPYGSYAYVISSYLVQSTREVRKFKYCVWSRLVKPPDDQCLCTSLSVITLRWRHNGRDSVSNHQPHDCLLNRLFRRRSKKTSKLRVTGLCAGNSPGTGEFPAQMASNAENVSIWWRHHAMITQ